MKRVLAFGSFDMLHKGHAFFLSSAAKLGDKLTVIVARDSYILSVKGKAPANTEQDRLKAVQVLEYVDEARLGEEPGKQTLLQELSFDVLVVGYDQRPDDEEIRSLLVEAGKENVELVRLPPFHPETYKSSLLRAAQ